ncbi:MAG: hypothetical protein ACFB0B_04755 [Thermonemataceae bacterium]
MKYLHTLFFLLALCLVACNDDDDDAPTDPQTDEDILISTTWRTDGFFADNQRVNVSTPNLELRFNRAFPANTININGNVTAPATWTLSVDGEILSISYPSGYANNAIQADRQDIDVRIDNETLAFINTTDEPVTIFGIISLPANYELRFIPQDATPSEPSDNTSSALTTGTWTGDNDGDAGLYNVNTEEKIQDVNLTFRFRTVFGINTLNVGGIPTPTTWSLNEAETELTLFIPSTNGIQERVLTISELTENSLIFTSTTSFSLYEVITINAENELRMVQEAETDQN